MDIICDTSIWDAMDRGIIAKDNLKGLNLVSVHNSFIDWINTDRFRDLTVDRMNEMLGPVVRNAIAFSELIPHEPFFYMIQVCFPGLRPSKELYHAIEWRKKVFQDLGNQKLTSDDHFRLIQYSLTLGNAKKRFLDQSRGFVKCLHDTYLVDGASITRESIMQEVQGVLLNNCQKYLERHCSATCRALNLSDVFDWSNFNLLAVTFTEQLLRMIKQLGKIGAPSYKGNDNIDLLNLAYVQKGAKYWTMDEKGVVPIIRQAKLDNFLFQLS